jgi:hypothetical protein
MATHFHCHCRTKPLPGDKCNSDNTPLGIKESGRDKANGKKCVRRKEGVYEIIRNAVPT